jgi:polysaccharide export outer membrane protein
MSASAILRAMLATFLSLVSVVTVSLVQAGDYGLQPGDALVISVWKEEELQRQVLVRPDGGINFPLVGEIKVEGRSVEQLQQELSEGLADFIPDPEVTVSIQNTGGNVIYVVGKVNRPGSFVAVRPTDVVQALGLAGALTRFADSDAIKVLRRENGVQTARVFRYSDIEEGENLEQNVILEPGDIVVVP